jgi:hypothetical protein
VVLFSFAFSVLLENRQSKNKAMPLIWSDFESFDLHVLRNNQPSVQIEQFVSFIHTQEVQYDGSAHNKTVIFTAKKLKSGGVISNFRTIAYFPSWVTADTFPIVPNPSSNGISVDVSNGTITAQALPPNSPATITSFGIRVVLFFDDNGTVKAQPRQLTILVHVHNSITKVWTTPAQLDVRPDIIKGIELIGLKILTPETIKRVKLYKTDAFTEIMDGDLLYDQHPFDLPQGDTIIVHAKALFDNFDFWPDNRVFYDPLHLEVTFIASDRFSQFTLPLHLWWLIKQNDIIKDQNGNDVFKVIAFTEKRQYQLSVYAAFDDGTVGDITNWHKLTWTHGPGFFGDDINFDSNGFFKVPVGSVGKTIDVLAKLPPALVSGAITEATGKVKVNPSFLTMDLVAKPVPQSPVQTDPDAVNVLFIAEGFNSEAAFSNSARDVCKKLREESKTAPWNYLFKSAINAWMFYQPSPEKGGTILYETSAFNQVELVNKEKVDLALPLSELAEFGPKLSNNITFHQFIARIGLPVPADQNKSKSNKVDEWKQLFGADIGSGDWSISDAVFDYWKKLGKKRTLVEERNTAFGLACGSKPALDPRRISTTVTFSNARLDYQHINLMLTRLRENSATGNLIGERFWGRDKSGKLGKDFGLLIFLVNGLLESGVRMGQMYYPQGEVNQGIMIGLTNDNLLNLKFLNKDLDKTYPYFKWKDSSNLPAIVLDPFENVGVSITSHSVASHELGHFFNLRDEYASSLDSKAPVDKRIDGIYNLQHRDSLLVNGKISGDKVKWRWPRIRKAAVLNTDPVASAGKITITVKPGQAAQFKQGEEVHFRKKNVLLQPIDQLTSSKLKIESINKDIVVLQPIQDAAFTGTGFEKGSLLVLLAKASTDSNDNPTHDEYAELMSSLVRKKINDTHKGQTKEPCETNLKEEQQPTNIPDDLADPDNNAHIVGLYIGGDEYSCDIYHPTGECTMRVHRGLNASAHKNLFTNQKDFTFSNKLLPFCPVCRYGLVDQINPSQHALIDNLYAGDYPDTTFFSRNTGKIILGGLGLIGLIIYGLHCLSEDNKQQPQ